MPEASSQDKKLDLMEEPMYDGATLCEICSLADACRIFEETYGEAAMVKCNGGKRGGKK